MGGCSVSQGRSDFYSHLSRFDVLSVVTALDKGTGPCEGFGTKGAEWNKKHPALLLAWTGMPVGPWQAVSVHLVRTYKGNGKRAFQVGSDDRLVGTLGGHPSLTMCFTVIVDAIFLLQWNFFSAPTNASDSFFHVLNFLQDLFWYERDYDGNCHPHSCREGLALVLP